MHILLRPSSRENKTFVLGGLFPAHEEGSISEGLRCGDVRIALDVEAMLYAIDKINADSNLLPGVELGYDIRDTCFSETVGQEEAFDLILTGSNLVFRATNHTAYDHVPTSGIIGAGGSRVSVPVASLGRLFEMPQISYSSTSPLLSDRARYSYFRRTVPSDDLQVLAIVGILKRFNWSYVSIIYSEDAYGSAGVNELVNISAVSEICIDLLRGIPQSFSESNFDSLVVDLGHSRANVTIFFAHRDTVGKLLPRINRNDTLRTRFTWIARDVWRLTSTRYTCSIIHQSVYLE